MFQLCRLVVSLPLKPQSACSGYAPLFSTVSAAYILCNLVLINFPVTQCQLHAIEKTLLSVGAISCCSPLLVSVKGILWGECLG